MGGLCGASLFPSNGGRRRGGFLEISNTALARKMGLSQWWLFLLSRPKVGAQTPEQMHKRQTCRDDRIKLGFI